MAPVQCVACKEIWSSKSKSGKHSLTPGHRLVFVCVPCAKTFTAVADLLQHQTAMGHRDPEELGGGTGKSASPAPPGLSRPVSVHASHASTVSGSGSASPSGVVVGEGGAMDGPACPVCQMGFGAYDQLAEHVSRMLPCAGCMTCLDPFQTLEDHYWDSPSHPKCKPCALGFENLGKWTEHKISCPVAPLGSRPAPNNSNGRAAGKRPTLPSPQPVTGPAPNTFGSTSLAGIAVSVASSTSSSEDGFRSTYSPGHLPNAYCNGAGPSRFAPTPTGGVPARAEAAVAETNGTTSFSCSKCKTQYASQELLQQHFNQSTMHHTCKTCGLGFETAASWATHRGRCPPPGSYKADAPSGPATTDGPVAIEPPAPDPARTPQADHAALRPQPTEPRSELGAPEANPSAAMMLASTMMLPSEDGRSPAASVSTSRASTPISVLRSTASSGPSVGGPASFYTPALSSRSVSNYGMSVGQSSAASTRSPTPAPQREYSRPLYQHAQPNGGQQQLASPKKRVSLHCRSCRMDPCVDPTTTACGHLFCHSCIMAELTRHGGCPVCQRSFLTKMHIEVEEE